MNVGKKEAQQFLFAFSYLQSQVPAAQATAVKTIIVHYNIINNHHLKHICRQAVPVDGLCGLHLNRKKAFQVAQ